MTITPVNDNPVAVADSKTIPEDTTATTIDVLVNDDDPDIGDTRTITAKTNGTKGTVSFTATSLTYTPNHNANGSDTFTYTITDSHGSTATGTVSVTITPVNDPPVAATDAMGLTVPEGAGATALPVLANDLDVDGDISRSPARPRTAHGGTVVITGGGTGLTYKPVAHYNGTDQFTYTLSPTATAQPIPPRSC